MYHYLECGLNNIYLSNGYEIYSDPEYGECVSITNVKGLNKAIAMDLVNHKPRLTGAEFRFLRKEMEMSQNALADLFGNNEQAIARWEKGGKIPKWADRLIRICMNDYYENSDGVIKLINHVKALDIAKQEKRVFEDNNDWKLAA
jgi:DNA-binding transcriptional regulator YiaG